MKRARSIIFIAIALLVAAIAVAGVYAFRQDESVRSLLPAQVDTTESVDIIALYDQGVLVTGVDRVGPAAAAGIHRGTVILSVDGQRVDSAEQLRNVLDGIDADGKVTLSVLNGGVTPEDVVVTLDAETPRLGVQIAGMTPEVRFGSVLEPGALNWGSSGALVVLVVEDSAAANAGIEVGDAIVAVDDAEIGSSSDLAAVLEGRQPGDTVKITIERAGETMTLDVTLGAAAEDATRPFLGVRLLPAPDIRSLVPGNGFLPEGAIPDWHPPFGAGALSGGAVVVDVLPDSAAAAAGIEAGDVVEAIDGVAVTDFETLRDEVAAHQPGDVVTLTVSRGDEQLDLTVKLGAASDAPDRAFLGVSIGAVVDFEFTPDSGQENGFPRFDPHHFFPFDRNLEPGVDAEFGA